MCPCAALLPDFLMIGYAVLCSRVAVGTHLWALLSDRDQFELVAKNLRDGSMFSEQELRSMPYCDFSWKLGFYLVLQAKSGLCLGSD